MATNAFKLWGEIALTGSKKAMKKLEKMGEKLKETGDAVKGVGEGFSTYVTLPLTALGAGAIASAVQVEQAQGNIQASLGLTAEEAEALNDKARNLWKQGFGTDMADIAGKVAEVTRHVGDLNEADLKDIIGGIDVLESQFGAETQEQMVAVNTLMENFGMSATEAMDYLVVGFQKGLDYSGEFIDTIREYSTYFNEMGFSGQEFFDTLAQGAEGGAFQLDKVGDSMKEFTLRAKATDEATVEAFEGIGTNATEMISAFNAGGEEARVAFEKTVKGLQGVEDETKRNEIAVALFGTQYEDLGKEAFDAMLTASGAMGDVEGATRTASEAMADNFGVELQILWRNLQDAIVPIGMVLIDIAEQYIPPFLEAIMKVAEWFKGLSTGGQNLVVILGLIVAGIGPFLVILGTIIGAIGAVIPVVMTLWTWFSKIKTVFGYVRTALLVLSGPVGLTIAIVASLIAIGILLYKNWDTVKAKASAVWNWIKGLFDKVGLGMLGPIGALIQAGINLYKNWDSVKAKFGTALNNMKTKATDTFNNIKTAISTAINKARDSVNNAINKIKGFFSNLKSALKIKIPKFDLPRFKLEGKLDLVPPNLSVPKLSVDWYAKGGIFDGPNVIGVGERGREAVLPLEGRYMKGLAETIAMQMPRTGGNLGNIIVPLYLNGREIARATAPMLDRELEKHRKTRATFRSVTT